MIKKLNNKNETTTCKIHTLFQASYRIEAELLNAIDFPPLKRTQLDFLTSDSAFYGLFKDNHIAAIVEINTKNNYTNIESLVVHPKYFRKGLGTQLLQFVLTTFDSETFTVETGLKNEPATTLYKQLGFKEQKQWDTEFGIRKIQFVKTKNGAC